VIVFSASRVQDLASPMIILVRNLDRATTEKELQALFFRFGRVTACDLVTEPDSGKSKGFGFVNMPNINEGLAAIAALNGSKLGKNLIRVKKAATSTVMKNAGKRQQP
jgi:RNA recognition motif-containing protein